MGPSLARNEFERLMAHEGFASTIEMLKAMVGSTPPTYETEYLDFKAGSVNGGDINEDDAKRLWSKAVAGFATSAGGVLIWGLDAREHKATKIDHVVGYEPVLAPDKLKSRLKKLLIDASDPPVSGVEIVAVSDPADGGKGVVICYIPESDYKPHRANQDGNRWRMRVGDNFVDVPPAILRSLFFPHRRSYIWAEVEATRDRDSHADPGWAVVYLKVRLINEGPSTANDLMVWTKSVGEKHFSVADGTWAKFEKSGRVRCSSGIPFHSGETLEMANIIVHVPVEFSATGQKGDEPGIIIDMRLFATDQPPSTITIVCPWEEMGRSGTIWRGKPSPVDSNRFS